MGRNGDFSILRSRSALIEFSVRERVRDAIEFAGNGNRGLIDLPGARRKLNDAGGFLFGVFTVITSMRVCGRAVKRLETES